MVKVVKFGGSSLASAEQFKKVYDIIKSDDARRYVVPSAPGKRFDGDNKITDLLYLCKTHIEHNLPYDQIFQVVADRYMAVEVNLGIEVDLLKYFDEIKENNIALIDVLTSLAEVSSANNFVRPKFNFDRRINIVEGRHPVIEKVLKDEYLLLKNTRRGILITGLRSTGKTIGVLQAITAFPSDNIIYISPSSREDSFKFQNREKN